MQVIVGLGNPGKEYALHRHNAGFWFLDALAHCLGLDFHFNSRWQLHLCCWKTATAPPCWLIKPHRYMNESGLSVRAAAGLFSSIKRVLIVHDELDLPVGVLRIKEGGGLGGHNGLRSIHRHLGSTDFKRLRIGVGHPGVRERVQSWLLTPPSHAVRVQIMAAIDAGLQHRDALLLGRFAAVMNVLHRRG